MNTYKEEIQHLIDQKIQDGIKKFGIEFKFAILEIIGLEKMIKDKTNSKNQPNLILLVKWNDYHPDPSVKALRMLVFRKDKNGFEDVIERRGKRILINEDKYFEWSERRKNNSI